MSPNKILIIIISFYSAFTFSQNKDEDDVKKSFQNFVNSEINKEYDNYINSISENSKSLLDSMYTYTFEYDSLKINKLDRTLKFMALNYKSILLRDDTISLLKDGFKKNIVEKRMNGISRPEIIGIDGIEVKNNKATGYLTFYGNLTEFDVFFIKENMELKIEIESLFKWRVMVSPPFNNYRMCCENEDLTEFFKNSYKLENGAKIWSPFIKQ